MFSPRFHSIVLWIICLCTIGCGSRPGAQPTKPARPTTPPIILQSKPPRTSTLPALEGQVQAPPASDPLAPTNADAKKPAPPTWRERVRTRLEQADWMAEPAQRVADFHAAWFELIAVALPGDAEQQLKRLASLGPYKAAQSYLALWPECAGLFATVDQPNQLAEIFRGCDEEDRNLLWTMFACHAGAEEANRLLTGLTRHRDAALKLARRGLLGSEIIFLEGDPLGRPGEREYHDWLADTMHLALDAPDDELATMVNFLILGGHELRERLQQDDSFRARFRHQLWPTLREVARKAQHPIYHYLVDEHLWDVLMLDRGDRLLFKMGPAASDLFCGPHKYHPELHTKLTDALLAGNQDTLEFLLERRHRQNNDLKLLLNKAITPGQLADVLNRVKQAAPNDAARLRYYVKLPTDILQKDLLPPEDTILSWIPLYDTTGAIYKSFVEGRELTYNDWLNVGIDLADVALTASTFGTGKIVSVSLRVGHRTVKMVMKGSRALGVARRLVKPPLRANAARLLARTAKSSTKSRFNLGMHKNWFGTRFDVPTGIDVTKMVRETYHTSGVGRKWFRRLTSLEARIFMRADARATLNLDVVLARVLENHLESTSLNLIKERLKADDEDNQRKLLSTWWMLNTDKEFGKKTVKEATD